MLEICWKVLCVLVCRADECAKRVLKSADVCWNMWEEKEKEGKRES